MSQKKFFSTTSNLHGRYWIWACMKLNFSFVHFRLWNYLLTYYLLYSSKFLKISVKRFQVFYIKYIIYLRVFSTGKSLRINYYTAEKAKSVDCIKSVSCLFDKFAQVRSRSSVVLKRMFSQIFRNLQKSPFVRALSPTTKDCDLQLYLKEILNRCFPVSFAAFLSTALSQDTYFRIWVFFQEHSRFTGIRRLFL